MKIKYKNNKLYILLLHVNGLNIETSIVVSGQSEIHDVGSEMEGNMQTEDILADLIRFVCCV